MDEPENLRNTLAARMASQDYERARRKAFMTDVFSIFSGRPNWLLSFEEVQSLLPIKSQFYRGLQQVPVPAIVGSVDRYHDFNRAFLPVQAQTRPRWESVDRATLTDVVLPPVQLYKIGDAYFVKDGNHRVSVAREKGQDFIDAEVIECTTTIPLSPDVDPRDLLLMAEYARFLDATYLDRVRPGAEIKFTSLGRYDTLLEHISAHRWFMGIEQYRQVDWDEAVRDWYDHVYVPVVEIIERDDMLQDFPGRTAADLYLWIMDHRWYLQQQVGRDVGPEFAAASYSEKYATSWTRRVIRTLRRMQTAATRPVAVTGQVLARALDSGKRLVGLEEEEEVERVPESATADTHASGDGASPA